MRLQQRRQRVGWAPVAFCGLLVTAVLVIHSHGLRLIYASSSTLPTEHRQIASAEASSQATATALAFLRQRVATLEKKLKDMENNKQSAAPAAPADNGQGDGRFRGPAAGGDGP